MKKRNNDNRGFSLVEIIITVAILSILMGVVGYGFNMTNGKPAEQCAKRLAATISNARTDAMGKYGNTITVKNDGGILKVYEEILVKPGEEPFKRDSVVGSKGVTVKYRIGTGGYDNELGVGDSIILKYNSGSGAMKTTAPSDKYYTGFKIEKAGKVWYVKLETMTGRVTYDTSDSSDIPSGMPSPF